ncbi:MAG: hypothetical protein WA620_05210 [Methylovirgula sp.]
MSPTEMNESYFIEMLSWLDQLAGNETSPDAFDNILLVAIGIVELIFDRAVSLRRPKSATWRQAVGFLVQGEEISLRMQ